MNVKRFSSPILQKAWIPYFILIFTLIISLFTMYFAGRESNQNDVLRFRNIVERTHGTIANQMVTYTTLLEGTTGLFAASESVTSNEFRVYVERLNLKSQYPGIQGIGYLERIPVAEKEALTQRLQVESMPDFRIWPENSQAFSTPIIYIEPLDSRNKVALGYDMSTEPVREAAMNRAMLSGKPAMSGIVTLVQEIDNHKQAGFLIYLPVYRGGIIPKTVEERQLDLQGFVYSPFRSDDLLRGILGGEKSPQIDFRVYDGAIADETMLHDSRKLGPVYNEKYQPRFRDTQRMVVAGRTWTIEYMTNQAFDAASDIWLVPFVFVFGILTSGVLFILSKAQYEAGRKAELSESNLHFIAETGKILASSLDYKKTIALVSDMGIGMFADWCSVDVKRDSSIEQIAISHKDKAQLKWAKRYRRLNQPDLKAKTGLPNVLRTGRSEIYPYVTQEMMRQGAKNDEEYLLIKKLHIHSIMIVPLRIHSKTIGAMTYISTDPKRRYTADDLAIAEEIAQRAAMAIEHARLFAESENAVRLRDDFISVASHELKTPVTSLKMYIQVIEKQLLKKGEKEIAGAMGKMDSQIDKLTLLIKDLLNVTRIQLGQLDFHDELFSLEEAVTETVEQIQPTTKKHKITIHGHIKKKIFGDRDRIGQVVINLLTNAIKYSPAADRIDVTLHEEKEGVRVDIRDYGIGIDEQHTGKIFSRFYRVTDRNEKTFPGLGIGLFISQEIIYRHGGKLFVTSKKGEGSIFSFTLSYKRGK